MILARVPTLILGAAVFIDPSGGELVELASLFGLLRSPSAEVDSELPLSAVGFELPGAYVSPAAILSASSVRLVTLLLEQMI